MEQVYRSVVDEIYSLQRFRGSLSLDPIQELMDALDHPETDFPVVHVAGTNGKGSTATILARVLEEAGFRTGLFTSPHLVDFTERIQVDGDPISREQVVDRYRRVADVDVEASFFEAMTAMALDHFSQEAVDVAVVETGMGGRLDATNVVEPVLSLVTNVAREHTTVLGETPEQIAYEIAGIVKDAPVLSGVTGEPGDVVRTVAAEHEVPLHPVENRVSLQGRDGIELVMEVDGSRIETGLVGRYQADNVDTALAAVDALPMRVPATAVREALSGISIPGRMEPVSRDPLVLLDGAHNPAAVERLPGTLDALDADRTIAVVSIMADKEYGEMLSMIEGFADAVVLSAAEIDRAADPDELAACIETVDCEVVRSVPGALKTAVNIATPDDTVFATGSLYFVGDVKKAVAQRPDVIAART